MRNELRLVSQRVNVSAAIRSLTMFGRPHSDDLREIQRDQEEDCRDNSQRGAAAKRENLAEMP